jgi:cell division protein FtsW
VRGIGANEAEGGLSLEACGRLITGIAFALTAVGLLMIYSASTFVGAEKFEDPAHFLKGQLVGVSLGLCAFFLCSRIPYRFWGRRSRQVVFVSATLLVLVLLFGSRFNGARRWIRFLGFGLQPSEVAKIAVIVHASAFLATNRERLGDFRRGFLPAVAPIGLLAVLTLVEPDFGTALFLAGLGLVILIVGGIRLTHVLASGAALLPAVTALMVAKFDYIGHRLAFFHSDGPSYQVEQAFISLGSGGFIGKGIGAGTGKLFFLPEVAGDFIFPAIGEETGFLGVTLVVSLFIAFAWCGLRLARRALRHDPFAFYLTIGIVTWITCQAVINLAVVSGAAPTKGIALPFISHGGSSLFVVLAATGILRNIARSLGVRRRIEPGRAG